MLLQNQSKSTILESCQALEQLEREESSSILLDFHPFLHINHSKPLCPRLALPFPYISHTQLLCVLYVPFTYSCLNRLVFFWCGQRIITAFTLLTLNQLMPIWLIGLENGCVATCMQALFRQSWGQGDTQQLYVLSLGSEVPESQSH